jgi:hypothetical protein
LHDAKSGRERSALEGWPQRNGAFASEAREVALMHEQEELQRYALATWHSFEKLTVPSTGLPADSIGGDLGLRSRARYTSPSNIAMYLWAVLAARDLLLVSPEAAAGLIRRTLDSLSALERHAPSGQFYNWYEPETLVKLTTWPESPGGVVYPFVSSVDNGWLASALIMVANAVPDLHGRAWRLVTSMNFGAYYDGKAGGSGPGLMRGGFWRQGEEAPGNAGCPRGDYASTGEEVVYTGHHYGALNTEPRITSYIAIALEQVPPEHYFAAWRALPKPAEGSRKQVTVAGAWRTYLGVEVFEGAYVHGERRVLPTWGGSMFEALMPTLVVPEKRWGEKSWAVTHPLYVEAQIEFGLDAARYGYWGFSPSSDPAGGYREYGVASLGMAPSGYAADAARLTLYGASSSGASVGPGHDCGEGVVTPHAAFLALDFAPQAVLSNLAALRRDFSAVYGPGGFKDAVNVATGQVADRYLALDQGMVMAAATNALLDNRLQDYLAVTLQPSIQPLMTMEEFAAGRFARPA